MNWPMLALLVLAAGRAVHLVGDDRVPFGYLRDWLWSKRAKPGKTSFAHWLATGLGCTFCLSIWAGFCAAWLAIGLDWVPDLDGWAGLGFFAVLWFGIAQAIVLTELTVFALLGDDH